jgi:hypothetical protein
MQPATKPSKARLLAVELAKKCEASVFVVAAGGDVFRMADVQGCCLPSLDLALPSFFVCMERRRARVRPVSYSSGACIWREPLTYHDVAKSERRGSLRLCLGRGTSSLSVFFSAEAGCPRPIIRLRLVPTWLGSGRVDGVVIADTWGDEC